MDKCIENVIEWLRDEKRATLSLSQRRTISRVKQLAEQYPDECQIVAENRDGSVCAHVPVSWVKISPSREVSETQREASRRNMQALRSKRVTSTHNPGQISTETTRRYKVPPADLKRDFPTRKGGRYGSSESKPDNSGNDGFLSEPTGDSGQGRGERQHRLQDAARVPGEDGQVREGVRRPGDPSRGCD